tara:strand:- start:4655 stop:5356 length:702 start_codon:yes stop_codon:yes gene_type:complete
VILREPWIIIKKEKEVLEKDLIKMFKREITGLILASLATILIFFSNLEIFYLMLLLVCFLLTFELVKVTNEMNIFFWIQIFFIILIILFLPTFEKFRQLFFIGIMISVLTDAGAYYVGKTIGNIKIFPTTSPNKTLEGIIGGSLFCVVFLSMLFWYFPSFFTLNTNLTVFVFLIVISSLASIFGDYLQSRFKRTQGVKDSGNILPGHGGLSDRLDSHLVTLPVFFGLINFFGL